MKFDFDIKEESKYSEEVQEWCRKFKEIMCSTMSIPGAVIGYYLPGDPEQKFVEFCPLGDTEIASLGIEMRNNSAAFEAAEITGLVAEGVDDIMYSALNNCGSWAHNIDNVRNILKDKKLCKYVSFEDKYYAEEYLFMGNSLCDDENAWYSHCSALHEKLDNRPYNRGYGFDD